jgi:copper transport protein
VSRGRTGRPAAAIAIGLATAALLVGSAGAADAHAELGGSSPAQGQRLEVSPRSIVLELTEPVVLDRTTVTVADADGRRVTTGEVTALPRDPLALQGAVALTVPVPALARGSYFVSWRTVSRDDMHQTYGDLAFGIGVDPVPAATGGQPPTWRVPGEALLRWGVFFGLAVLVGATALRRLAPDRGSDALRRLAEAAGWAAVLAGAALEVLLLASAPAALGQSRFGQIWTAYLLVILLATRSARSRRPGAPTRTLALAATGYLLAALVGHPAAAGGGVGWLTLVTATHLISTALWSGGVVALAVALRAERSSESGSGSGSGSAWQLVRRFAVLAVPGLLLSVVSGLLLAGVLVPSVAALTGSGYGRSVAAKLLLTVLAAGLGLATAIRLRRAGSASGSGSGSGSRLILAEAGLLVGALALAGLLGSLGPPTAPRYAATPRWSADQAPRSVQVDDLLVNVSTTPNRPGQSFLLVEVNSTRRPQPAPVVGVRLTLAGARPVPAVAQPDGSWLGPAQILPRPGPVRIEVRVLRPGLPDAVAEVDWVVAALPGTYRGGRPLTDLTRWALLLIPLLVVGAAPVTLARNTRARNTVARNTRAGNTVARNSLARSTMVDPCSPAALPATRTRSAP